MPKRVKKTRRIKPGFTGLSNTGASCYINSIVQVFSHTYEIYNYCLNDITTDGGNLTADVKPLAVRFRNVLRRIWSGKTQFFLPRQLYRTIKRILPQFNPYRQTDCHEFMISFSSVLHKELRMPTTQLTDGIIQDGYKSIIRDIFYGQHSIQITCTFCAYQKSSTEVFNNLSLALPNHRTTLKEVLELHYMDQPLEDYYCPRCNLSNGCINKTTVSRNPQLLVLCLKRFMVGFVHGEYSEFKNATKVHYPRRDLEFGGKKYHLYSVIVHRADDDFINSGHYWAYCKNYNDDNWFKFDDDHVRRASKREVFQPKKSYLLFYRISTE